MISPDFDRIYDIMHKSFPTDEHRPYDEQKALLLIPEYSIRTLAKDGDIIGFIALWDFPDFIFIEHFAIDEKYRNEGCGKKFLQDILHEAKKPVCLEAEPPTDSLTTRRISFYKRCGLYLNEYTYIQPPISKGRAPVELKIMTYPHGVDEAKFEKIRTRLYKDVYKTDISFSF